MALAENMMKKSLSNDLRKVEWTLFVVIWAYLARPGDCVSLQDWSVSDRDLPLGCTDCDRTTEYCDMVVGGQCRTCKDPCRPEALTHNDRCRTECPDYFLRLVEPETSSVLGTTQTDEVTSDPYRLNMAIIIPCGVLAVLVVILTLLVCYCTLKRCRWQRNKVRIDQETQSPDVSELPNAKLLEDPANAV